MLSDFKKFAHYTVSCRSANVLVGPNNAGKSSLLDALRVLADVLRYSRQQRPELRAQGEDGVCATYVLPDRSLSIPIANTVRNYGNDYARLEYRVSNGAKLVFRVHPDHGCYAHIVVEGNPPRTSTAFRSALDLNVIVVPTLSALEEDENYVTDETVHRNENTRLASRSFRNIVFRQKDDEFDRFRSLCQAGWPDVNVQRPEVRRGHPAQVTMMYAEDRIDREVYWAGFGFQVWMQMMLQFMRADVNSILVLDEPDIYLHADLQRKILSLSKENFSQFFLATHSTEIINEADPGDVLMIDSGGRSARRVSTDDGFKRVYNYLGSSENAEFARVARAKRIVFFEGKDRGIVRKLARKAGSAGLLDDPYTIYLQAGGFSQWRRIKEIDWALHEIFGIDAKIGALFDRDYRCDEEAADFSKDLATEDLWVGVLGRKEIENYALAKGPLVRTIVSRVTERGGRITEAQAEALLVECSQQFRDGCMAQQQSMFLSYHKPLRKDLDDATHLSIAMTRFNQLWDNLDTRFRIVPGKDYIATLSTRLQKEFGASVTIHQIIDEMAASDVDSELVGKLSSLAAFFAAD
ncbi:ATP-dependent nuclease [Devosia sp.]|uniref:ATP-dependent nuclease n=1 Tax=Devosia sp. TaxID=1871048 RepID=UPI003BAA1A46